LPIAAVHGLEIENNAWFWLIGSSAPLQSAQFFGAKFHEIIFTSPEKAHPRAALSFQIPPEVYTIYTNQST
jgi:hypothetical protein